MRPRSVRTAATRPFLTSMPVTLVSSQTVTPRPRAPLASAWVMSEGLACPSVGRKAAPTTSCTSMIGHSFFASVADSSSISSPKLRAVVAWRLTSVQRSCVQARRRPPFIFQPVAWPVSASSRRYRSTLYFSSRVMLAFERSWPTRPAAWNVEPLVSLWRSSTTTSRTPARVRW